jgi:hypothetical protein
MGASKKLRGITVLAAVMPLFFETLQNRDRVFRQRKSSWELRILTFHVERFWSVARLVNDLSNYCHVSDPKDF